MDYLRFFGKCRYGALFWPDFKIRKNESELSMWELMGMKGRYFKELEFESGQIVLNKEKVRDFLISGI